MTTPQERRQALINDIARRHAKTVNPNATRGNDGDLWSANHWLDLVLEHLDETGEKPVAEAVRFGVKELQLMRPVGAQGQEPSRVVFEVDYPETGE